jgi:hypothetical protein
MEDQWLTWAKRLQAIASTGLHFGASDFDKERYQDIHDIANKMLATLGQVPIRTILDLVPDTAEGYATPKVDVRGAVFKADKILLVKEKLDGLWTLPGGYADVCISPSENVEKEIQEEASTIAGQLFGKIPIIYSESSKEGVAVRFRQQINENAKMLCWHHAIPEMNHNELVGWRTKNQDLAAVIFRSTEDYYRNQKRMEYSKKVIKNYTDTVLEIYAKGDSPLEEALYLIHLGDWVSYFLGELKGIDSVEVDVITGLKDMLAKLD